MNKLFNITFGMSLALCTIGSASAHYLWIEQAPSQPAKLYFGEVPEGKREVSGGKLDNIKGLTAWQINAEGAREAIEIIQQPNHFQLGKADAGSVIAEALAIPVREAKKPGDVGTKTMYYSRLSPASVPATAKPELALDILPSADSANGLTVYFNNAPLPKAKVLVYAPNLWIQEHTTDDTGKVKINTPWAGRYVVDVAHKVEQPGEFEGKKFAATNHRTTLSFEVMYGAE